MRVVIGVTLHAGKRHAVVRSDDDQSLLGFPALIERGEQRSDLRVVGFKLDRVVEHVSTHDVVVGPIRGDAVDVGGLLAGRDAGVQFVAPMRIVAAKPIKERLARRAAF
ncbi:MAG: hypothetical protein RL077_5889 [Verrucomicrobiota bacterium]